MMPAPITAMSNVGSSVQTWGRRLREKFARPAVAELSLAELERDLGRVKTLAKWLDTRFSLMGYRFGFDSIIGLVPVAGDTFAALLGAYPIWVAYRHRLSGGLQARMAFNLFLEWVIGLVPLIGDLFDTVFKANVRNAALLERAVADRVG